MNQAIPTLLAVLAVALPVTAFFTLVGRAALNAAGVAEAPLTLWLAAPAAGAVCWSAALFFLLSLAGFHPWIVWTAAATVVALSFAVLRGTWRAAAANGQAALILILLAAVAVIPNIPLLPAIKDGGLYFGLPLFDHIKAALVDSIYRQGLPPISPFIAPDGKPAALFYYYGWYVLAAQIRAVFGCSGYIADVALSHVTALSSLALMSAVAYRCSGSRAAIGGVVLIALAADPEGLLARIVGWGPVQALRGYEWGLDNWLEQSFWAPQHMFAATGVVFAVMLVCWMCAPSSRLWRLMPILGAAGAAAVTSSIYAGAVAFVAMSIPAALVLWRMTALRQIALALLSAVLAAGLLAAPMIVDLAALGGGPSKILEFWIYPSLGFVEQTGIAGKIAHVGGFWIVLLPVRLGLVYVLGLWAMWRTCPARHGGQYLFWILSLIVIFSGFAVAQFIKSAIERNDLGWRVIIPAVLLLTAAAGAKIGQWVDVVATRQQSLPPSPRWPALFGLLVTVAISVPLMLFGVQQAGEHFVAATRLDPAQRDVHRLLADQKAAWQAVQARTGPGDLVISNPPAFDGVFEQTWGANLPWALYADRSSLLSSANWAGLMSSQLRSSGIIETYANLLDRLFAGTAIPDDVAALAGPLKVRMILVTPLDGLWTNDNSISGRFEAVAQGEGYRLYAPRRHP